MPANPKLVLFDYFQVTGKQAKKGHRGTSTLLATFEVTYQGKPIVPDNRNQLPVYSGQKLGQVEKHSRPGTKVTDWFVIDDPEQWLLRTRHEAAERLLRLRLFPKIPEENQK